MGVGLPAPSVRWSPPALCTRETEAQGSDTAGRKATATKGTEPRRHQIPGPKLTFFRAETGKAAHRVVGEMGREEDRVSLLYFYIYI